jgi:TonB family protein
VTDISVVKGLPDGLTEKAIAAARQVRFNPAEKDGHKVSQYVVFEYYFMDYFDAEKVDERAVILEQPPAEYPEAARRDGVTGKVVLKVVLTSFGSVSIISVEERLPYGLTEKAVAATSLIKFKPATLKGRVVSQTATVEYSFGL